MKRPPRRSASFQLAPGLLETTQLDARYRASWKLALREEDFDRAAGDGAQLVQLPSPDADAEAHEPLFVLAVEHLGAVLNQVDRLRVFEREAEGDVQHAALGGGSHELSHPLDAGGPADRSR